MKYLTVEEVEQEIATAIKPFDAIGPKHIVILDTVSLQEAIYAAFQKLRVIAELRDKNERVEPYIKNTVEVSVYNPEYGDNRICCCGHKYYRHFDTYEDMAAVGCKYCPCDTFEEIKNVTP